MSIHVMIVDDHPMIADGIRVALEHDLSIKVIATAKDGQEAIQKCQKKEIHVILMDITMPVMDGVEASKQIKKLHPAIQIIGLSMHDDPINLSKMLKAGATGYLLKSVGKEELRNAIRKVFNGETYISQEVTKIHYSEPLYPEKTDQDIPLTSREIEVLRLITRGRTTVQIAKELGISDRTVETHRKNILRKSGAESMSGLVRYAFSKGIS